MCVTFVRLLVQETTVKPRPSQCGPLKAQKVLFSQKEYAPGWMVCSGDGIDDSTKVLASMAGHSDRHSDEGEDSVRRQSTSQTRMKQLAQLRRHSGRHNG